MAQLLCAVAWAAAAHAAAWGGAPAHRPAPQPRPATHTVYHAPIRAAAPARTAPAPAATPQAAAAPAAPAAPAAQTVTTAATGGSTSQIIEQAFGPYGPAAVAWGQRVAACESGGSATAQNASGATGLFQFMPSTFAATPQGRAGASITDPVASAQAAAWMYSQGQQGAWSCN